MLTRLLALFLLAHFSYVESDTICTLRSIFLVLRNFGRSFQAALGWAMFRIRFFDRKARRLITGLLTDLLSWRFFIILRVDTTGHLQNGQGNGPYAREVCYVAISREWEEHVL